MDRMANMTGLTHVPPIMARITADNEASRRLHERLGFRLVGIERETAFKLGRWHDAALMQRML